MERDSSTALASAIVAFCDSQTQTDKVTQRWLGDMRHCASQLQSGDVDAAILTWGAINRSLSDCVPWKDDLVRDFYGLIRDIRNLRKTHTDIPAVFAE